MRRAHLRIVALLAVVAMTAAACATSADTTALDATENDPRDAAPTSTIVRTRPAEAEPGTDAATPAGTGTATDPTAVLTSLLAQLSADPSLVARLGELDAVGIADLLGVDLAALQQLGLTPDQLTALGQGVVGAPPAVQQELVGGSPDPAVLLALLAGSLDLESLADGTIATIVQALLAAITGTRIVVSPELTIDLGELLGEIDPEGLGPIAADPANASLLALLTSAWLGANPLLARQLLANPQLDPALRDLLQQLQLLSESIGETARNALLEALYTLIPALDPTP